MNAFSNTFVPDLKPLIERAMELADNEVADAAVRLYGMLIENETLYRAVAESFVRQQCRALCDQFKMAKRAKVWSPPPPKPVPAGANAAMRAAIRKQNSQIILETSMLEYPMENGTLLGNAKRHDVEEFANYYLSTSKVAAHKGRWMAAIAAQMPDNKRVRDVFTNEQLRDLQQKTAA